MGALLLFSVNELYYLALTSPKGSGELCFKMDFCWGGNSNIFWCSHRRIRLCSQTWSPHFYCLAKNDNKDLPCLRVRFHIHLNWCLAGCTEWRWICKVIYWKFLTGAVEENIEPCSGVHRLKIICQNFAYRSRRLPVIFCVHLTRHKGGFDQHRCCTPGVKLIHQVDI